MKSKPLSPPPAICGSNIRAHGGRNRGEISAIYTTSQSTTVNLLAVEVE